MGTVAPTTQTRETAMNAATQAAFQNAVLNLIGHTQDGESISFVLQELRYKGWKGFGSISQFETTLTDAGFKLRRVYKEGTNILRATYVTL